MSAKKVRCFFPCKIFPPGMWKWYGSVPKAGYYVAVRPTTTSLGKAESPLCRGEDSNLCCHCSRWDPTASQTEPAASRAIASHSCKLPLVFVRGKAGTLGLQPFLGITGASPARFAAGRDVQLHGSGCRPVWAQRGLQTPAVQGWKLLLPWGGVAGAEQSSLGSAPEPRMGLTSEIKRDQGAGSIFLTGKGPDQLLLPALAEFGAELLSSFSRGRSSPPFRATASAPRSCWLQQ